jgi:hypothetical protein
MSNRITEVLSARVLTIVAGITLAFFVIAGISAAAYGADADGTAGAIGAIGWFGFLISLLVLVVLTVISLGARAAGGKRGGVA